MSKNIMVILPAIAWFIISTILLILPGSSFPKEDWLSKIWFDKWVHIGLLAIMVFLWCTAAFRLNKNSEKLKKTFLSLTLIWIAYGIMMEFIQLYFVPNRSFDSGDIIADAVGCVLGFLFSWRKYMPKQHSK